MVIVFLIMAPIAVQPEPTITANVPVKQWSRPSCTKENIDYASLSTIDLSHFDEPGGKQELATQLYKAVTETGFWVAVNTGLDDEAVLRQFSIGNAFFKAPIEEKRFFPCNFAKGEYFGYRENSSMIGDTGVKQNIEAVCDLHCYITWAWWLIMHCIAKHPQRHSCLVRSPQTPNH